MYIVRSCDIAQCLQLLAVFLRALLRESRGKAADPLVTEAVTALHSLLSDGSPVVLKAVCESLRICVPSLAVSSQPQLGQLKTDQGETTAFYHTLAVGLVQSLLTSARPSSYWLAKVELLRTLACLPLTALALSLPTVPRSLLYHCIFPLLGDTDHR